MHDQSERPEREREQSDQDPAPMKESDAERVTGEQATELDDESGSASSDPQQQDD
jgi:hypothetical protein